MDPNELMKKIFMIEIDRHGLDCPISTVQANIGHDELFAFLLPGINGNKNRELLGDLFCHEGFFSSKEMARQMYRGNQELKNWAAVCDAIAAFECLLDSAEEDPDYSDEPTITLRSIWREIMH